MTTRGILNLAWVWYLVGLAMLLGVAILSLIPVSGVGANDKLSHIVTYLIVAGWFSLLARKPMTLVWVIAGLVLYGILIEGLQATTGYRYAEWGDVLANTIGVLMGVLLYFSPLARALRYIDAKLAPLLRR